MTLINPAAREILFNGPGKDIAQTPLLADLQEVLQTGEPIYDRELGCNGLLLISNTRMTWSAPSAPSVTKPKSASCCSGLTGW
jgi:sensor histidine kinase regulating citrate/malate metabolism